MTYVTFALLLIAVALMLLLMVRLGGANWRATYNELQALRRGQEKTEAILRGEMSAMREESARNSRELREEVAGSVASLGASFSGQLLLLTDSNEARLAALRQTVDERLRLLQEDNGARLDEMRRTVDERLETTLEKRLGESFRQVSERLEAVHEGLGEMRSLAAGVGDLKRVLTNVKTRGTWGEVQLGNLLEQVLSPGQYEANVCCRPGTQERVEYALRLPGRDAHGDDCVWLPIDAKFPVEDYNRVLEAGDSADPDRLEAARRQLEQRVRDEAKSIQTKYLNPPVTTDFAVMFLPAEGLYAEVLRRPGLAEALQVERRVLLAGPTTLAALLNSLQMGFRTLAIERRSSEVWQLLGVVKTQFSQFGAALEKVQTRLTQASTTIDEAARKTRSIERKLKDVEALPYEEGQVTEEFLAAGE